MPVRPQPTKPQTRQPYDWEFHKGRKVLTVKTSSQLLVNDAQTMLTECVSGTGIAQVFTVAVRDLLESRKLVELFPDWSDEKFPLYAYYPSRHHPAAKVRAFVEFVLQAVRCSDGNEATASATSTLGTSRRIADVRFQLTS